MLTEYVIYQPAHGNWPELEWARAVNKADADWLLAVHRQLWYDTTFAMRTVTYAVTT